MRIEHVCKLVCQANQREEGTLFPSTSSCHSTSSSSMIFHDNMNMILRLVYLRGSMKDSSFKFFCWSFENFATALSKSPNAFMKTSMLSEAPCCLSTGNVLFSSLFRVLEASLNHSLKDKVQVLLNIRIPYNPIERIRKESRLSQLKSHVKTYLCTTLGVLQSRINNIVEKVKCFIASVICGIAALVLWIFLFVHTSKY